MPGSKDNAKIEDVRAALRQHKGHERYVILGSEPYVKGCRLFDLMERKTILMTKTNYEMLELMTRKNFDLHDLASTCAKQGFFPELNISKDPLTFRQWLSQTYHAYRQYQQNLEQVVDQSMRPRVFENKIEKLIKQKA